MVVHNMQCHLWPWRYWSGRGVIEAVVAFEWRFRDMSGVFLIQTPLLKAAWYKGFDISGVNDVSFLPWSGE